MMLIRFLSSGEKKEDERKRDDEKTTSIVIILYIYQAVNRGATVCVTHYNIVYFIKITIVIEKLH